METLKEYLEKHGLTELYKKAARYIPLPPPEKVVVEDFMFTDEGPRIVFGYVKVRDTELSISFRQNPPDILTFLHEVIHLAGGGEVEAYNYVTFLRYAVENDLPPFDLFKLSELKREDVEEVLREFGIDSIEEYFKLEGILVPVLDNETAVELFLAELSGAIEWSPLARQIFKKIAQRL